MSVDALVERLQDLQPGERIAEIIALAREEAAVATETDTSGGESETYYRIEAVDVDILPEDANESDSAIEAISYGPKFPGSVNGISMGMTGDEVEDAIGSPDRLWPMPHPNYVLLYDYPHFFRVELDRKTEKVIRMMR